MVGQQSPKEKDSIKGIRTRPDEYFLEFQEKMAKNIRVGIMPKYIRNPV